MSKIWVYKADGTLQCGQGQEIPLATMREELEGLIGKDNVLAGEKRSLGHVITLCGAPTGQVNAYGITEFGLWVLLHGIRGPEGFKVWFDEESDGGIKAHAGEDPFPLMKALLKPDPNDPDSMRRAVGHFTQWVTEAGAQPTQLSEVIGRACRVYRTGDPLTMDYQPNRVNIELSKDNRIVSIWFG